MEVEQLPQDARDHGVHRQGFGECDAYRALDLTLVAAHVVQHGVHPALHRLGVHF